MRRGTTTITLNGKEYTMSFNFKKRKKIDLYY